MKCCRCAHFRCDWSVRRWRNNYSTDSRRQHAWHTPPRIRWDRSKPIHWTWSLHFLHLRAPEEFRRCNVSTLETREFSSNAFLVSSVWLAASCRMSISMFLLLRLLCDFSSSSAERKEEWHSSLSFSKSVFESSMMGIFDWIGVQRIWFVVSKFFFNLWVVGIECFLSLRGLVCASGTYDPFAVDEFILLFSPWKLEVVLRRGR